MRKKPRQMANFKLAFDQHGKQIHSDMAGGGETWLQEVPHVSSILKSID